MYIRSFPLSQNICEQKRATAQNMIYNRVSMLLYNHKITINTMIAICVILTKIITNKLSIVYIDIYVTVRWCAFIISFKCTIYDVRYRKCCDKDINYNKLMS